MKLIKMYGWRENLRYCILLPKWVLKAVIGIAKGDHKLNDFTVIDYVSLAFSQCDAEAGRLYECVLEEEKMR